MVVFEDNKLVEVIRDKMPLCRKNLKYYDIVRQEKYIIVDLSNNISSCAG